MKRNALIGSASFILTAYSVQAAEYPAITRAAITLCRTPGEHCVANTFISSTWGGCRGEPKGCYPRSFEMELPKGDPVSVIAKDRMDAKRNWVFLKARWCVPDVESPCRHTFEGWAPRSAIAYLDEFKRMTSWPGEPSFQIEAGDYAEVIKVNKNASFSLSDGDRGAMFVVGDIVWAKFRRRPTDTQLIFIPAENKKYCWTTNPEEEVSGNERSNCFSGPFIK